MRFLVPLLLLSPLAVSQTTPDAKIRLEFQEVMSLAAPPAQGGNLDETAAQARAERFKASLEAFVTRWKAQGAALKEGKFTLARALALAGRPAEAVAPLEAFIKEFPSSPDIEEARLSLGSAYLDQGRAADAVRVYTAFLESYPKSERRHVATYYLGLARYQLGETDAAIALVRSVAESGIDDRLVSDAHIKLIELLRNAGRVVEARKELAPLLERYSESEFLRTLREQLDLIGRAAPELNSIDTWLGGDATKLADLRGRVIVLTFFVSWAEASQEELKALAGLRTRLSTSSTAFLALTKYYVPFARKSRKVQLSEMEAFLKERGVTWRCGMATDFSNLKAYSVRGVPETVVIGKDGRIAYIKYGASRKDLRGLEDLRQAIERALM